MTDRDILKRLVIDGAKANGVEKDRALGLLERVLAGETYVPGTNHVLFYKLTTALGHSPKVLYTPGRANKLKARLRLFTPEQLLFAAELLAQDEFLQGGNDNAKKYGNIDYLLRKDEIIDNLIADAGERGVTQDLTTLEF